MEILDRPYTVQDDDLVLRPTETHDFVDTVSHSAFFEQFLLDELERGSLPIGDHLCRTEYRAALIRLLAGHSNNLPEGRKKIIFAGGGYGAGKTTVLHTLACARKLEVPPSSILGTDIFKLFLPEFSRLKRVSDGRASTIVQKEAKLLSDQLFDVLLGKGRSFIWDSSMSDREATTNKILAAQGKGYHLEMVAVISNLKNASFRAMNRAKEIRRFAHPDFLPESHRGFARNFIGYLDYFQEVRVFHNIQGMAQPKAQPLQIGVKGANDNHLAVSDMDALNTFLALGQL